MNGVNGPRREVGFRLVAEVADPSSFALAAVVARGLPVVAESLDVRLDGVELATREIDDVHGGRLHLFEAGTGTVSIDYAASVVGRAAPAPVTDLDTAVYLRPSRYVQSDALTPFARETFLESDPRRLVHEVANWVHDRLDYIAEASTPTGGALETLEAGAGVCRDYAHLTAALLRGRDVPARLVSVFAPGLEPRDFHAVVEALVDGRWVVVDATRLAARSTMVRIATGRDAADVAFLTNTLADIQLVGIDVTAGTDAPVDEDPGETTELS